MITIASYYSNVIYSNKQAFNSLHYDLPQSEPSTTITMTCLRALEPPFVLVQALYSTLLYLIL